MKGTKSMCDYTRELVEIKESLDSLRDDLPSASDIGELVEIREQLEAMNDKLDELASIRGEICNLADVMQEISDSLKDIASHYKPKPEQLEQLVQYLSDQGFLAVDDDDNKGLLEIMKKVMGMSGGTN